jgi:hypothetical protein
VRTFATKRRLGIGLGYLVKSYASEPAPNPAVIPGFTNTHMKFMMIRETWERYYQDGYGIPNYDFLDNCFDTAEANGKGVALQIEPGINSPSEFFDLPNAKHIIAGADLKMSTVPFDPVFQTQWITVQTQLSNRYKNRGSLRFVKIQGPGIASESFFARTPEEQAQADVLASDLGYSDKFAAWLAGVCSEITMYSTLWYPVPIQLVTGSPYGTLDGSIALLQEAYDFGSRYIGQFAPVAHDLNSVSPHSGEISQTVITSFSPTARATGYQFGNEQNDLTKLTAALQKGVGYGAHEIEMFSGDADNAAFASLLDATNAQMLSV